jgi:hypothetical protein
MLTNRVLGGLVSDHLYTWSDEYTKGICCRTAKASQPSCASITAAQIDFARVHHRAVQAMRQAGMQMRRRSRSWPEVLSISELSGPAATNGLRSAGGLWTDGGVSRQLSPEPRNSGDDLRDQPRIAAPSRGALKRQHERVSVCSSHSERCELGRRACRQHARRLARRQRTQFVLCGGSL